MTLFDDISKIWWFYNTIHNIRKILFSKTTKLQDFLFKSSLKIILKNTIEIN